MGVDLGVDALRLAEGIAFKTSGKFSGVTCWNRAAKWYAECLFSGSTTGTSSAQIMSWRLFSSAKLSALIVSTIESGRQRINNLTTKLYPYIKAQNQVVNA